ncbi:MAG: DNA-binding response regulator [Ferruginibacter sp.]|nr:DNA-binding response regulator [Ferruginibacter sp.]
MTKQPHNVVLVDDHVLLRDALASYLDKYDEIKVSGVACNGEELLESLKQGPRPELIVLDLNMPKMDGYETAALLKARHPEIHVLVLTMYDSEIALIRLLQVGVRGFLKKDIHPGELRAAIIAIVENGYYYSHNATGKLASLFRKDAHNQNSIEKAMLSVTEIEFLRFASTDMTYKEIAGKMRITPRAIDGYRDALFDKLDVKSRVGLAIYAVKNGIVVF